MASNALLFAGATAGLDLLSGFFDFFASEQAAQTAESRGRMLRMESEAEAQRYSEQVRGFKASQKMAFLKSGVTLSGSPLDVLDETTRIAEENISAIRARGAARQLDAGTRAAGARIAGRGALLRGITTGAGRLAWASYVRDREIQLGEQNRRDIPLSGVIQ